MRVAALEGESLYEVAIKHDIVIGDSFSCHVTLSPDSYAAHDVTTRPLDPLSSTRTLLSSPRRSRRMLTVNSASYCFVYHHVELPREWWC